MRRRYDLRRSDNYMFTGRVSTVVTTTSGTITVVTGFSVMRATVSFATIPCDGGEPSIWSSSSSSSSEGSEYVPCPRIYVSSYTSTGFVVTYEGISLDVGYVEFNYSAV